MVNSKIKNLFLKKLFNERKKALSAVGLDITLEKLEASVFSMIQASFCYPS